MSHVFGPPLRLDITQRLRGFDRVAGEPGDLRHAAVAVTIASDDHARAPLVPLDELDRPEFPRLIPGTDPERPIIQLPLYGRYVHAPTAAVLYQFREIALHGRATRVAHFDQPTFAWR